MNGTTEASSMNQRPGTSVRAVTQASKVPETVANSDAPAAISTVLTIASTLRGFP